MELGYLAVDADNHYYETPRCLHPAPPEGVPPAGRADRPAGHALAPARGREAVQVHPQSHLRPDHRRRVHGRHVPRPDPRGCRPAFAHEARAAAGGVPGPRRASRGHGRAGTRERRHVPDASRSEIGGRCCATTSKAHQRGAPRVQQLARRRLGLRAPGPHLRRADALARRPRRRHRRARMGALPRRPHGAPASRAGSHRERQGSFRSPPRPRSGLARVSPEADVPVAFHLR